MLDRAQISILHVFHQSQEYSHSSRCPSSKRPTPRKVGRSLNHLSMSGSVSNKRGGSDSRSSKVQLPLAEIMSES